MAALSVEVIEDILSRLPVIDLLRFRCVSKPWCSLIDSSYFIKKHLNRSIETNKTNLNLVLQDWRNHEFHFLHLDSPDKLVKLNSDFEGSKTEVLGSCNGLLCLCLSNDTEEKCIVLWNPSTQKSQKLPDAPIENPNPLVWVDQTVFYGFGYEPTSDDYKLLRIVHFYIPNDFYAYGSQVDVYSLKSNSWRRVHDSPPSFTHKRHHEQECVIVDGAMHWAGTLISENGEPDIFIIAFDLGVEEFRFVPQPKYSNSMIYGRVGMLDGSLYLLSFCDVFSLHMWVMKDYGVKESWSKLFSVERTDQVPSKFLKPLAFSKGDGKILIQLNSCRLCQYDLKKKRIKKVMIPGITNDFHIHICLGSLVQLDGDGDGGSDEKQ